MMFKNIFIFIVFTIALFANQPDDILTKEEKTWIKNNTIIVGVSPWYPITYYENGKVKGVGIDMLNYIIKNFHLNVKFKPDQWSNLLTSFKEHKIDMLPTTYYTQQRATFGNYTSPYMKIRELLYVKSSSNIDGFQSLKGKKLAMVKSYGTIDKIKRKFPSIQIIEVDTLEQTVKMLLNDEVDAIFNTQFSIDTFLKNNFITGLKPLFQTDFKISSLYYFTNKSKPILNSIMNKGVEILDDDIKNKILSKWIQIQKNMKNNKFSLTKEEKAYLKHKTIIKMCNNPNWTPIEFAKNGNMNEMSGIAIDTMKIIEKQLNIQFINVPTKSWSQSQQFLKEKKCDILPCAVETTKRKQYANFTKPYLKLPLAIFTNKDKRVVSGLDEIMDKPWTRQKGSGLITKLKKEYPNMKVIETKGDKEALMYVNSGKAYFTIATLPVASYVISKYMLKDIHIAGYTGMVYNLSIAVRDDDKMLLTILDKSLSNISKEQSKQIMKKWVNGAVKETVVDYTLVMQILVVVALIIVFFLYRQYMLQKSIKESTELLNATMEAVILHKDGLCLYVNQSALEMFGASEKDDILGRNIFDYVSDKSKHFVKEQMIQNNTHQYEAVLLRKDNTEFYGLVQGKYIQNKNLRLAGVIDITKLKEQETTIAQQSKMVAMGEMIGNIAHQWRQPLSVISTAATGLQLQQSFGTLTDEFFEESCKAIDDNAQYLSKTIDDFKNFIQGDRKQEYFNLTKNIQSFLQLVQGSVKANNIHIELNLDDTIEVNGYANELMQCYINIFNNAKDVLATKTQEEKLIFITTQSDSKNAIIKMKDNGGGIPDAIIDKIFEPYFTTKHKNKGTGLGLHMTYNLIVDGMKGSIRVKNCQFRYKGINYRGAEFKITIPLN